MAMVDADSSHDFFLADSQSKSVGLVWGLEANSPLSLHSSNEPGKLSQWLRHDDSIIYIILVIIIIIIIIIVKVSLLAVSVPPNISFYVVFVLAVSVPPNIGFYVVFVFFVFGCSL